MAKFLQTKEVVDSEAADTLAPLMMTYFRSVWQGGHPPLQVGRSGRGPMPNWRCSRQSSTASWGATWSQAGDILMQRFRCMQLASSHGWQVASQPELSNRADASFVPMEMREEALRDHRRESKITEGLRKSKGAS